MPKSSSSNAKSASTRDALAIAKVAAKRRKSQAPSLPRRLQPARVRGNEDGTGSASLKVALEPPAPSAAVRTPRLRHHAGRAQILAAIRQAAIAEFASLGFQGASVQRIAQRAGISKQQLLYYCGSKVDLYVGLLHEVISGWREALSLRTDTSDNPAVVLGDYIRRKLDYALDQGALSRIFTQELLSGAPYVSRYLPAMHESMLEKVHLLERWMDEGRMRRRPPLLLLQQIWGMTQYFADYHIQVRTMMGQTWSREQAADEIVETVLRSSGL